MIHLLPPRDEQVPLTPPVPPEPQVIDSWNTTFDDVEEDNSLTEYRVRLRRRAHGREYFSVDEEVDVMIEAENEDEAERLVLRMESRGELDGWEQVGDRDYGDVVLDSHEDIEVDEVEET